MSDWSMVCLIFAVTFGIFAMIFAGLKEKGAILISGFNTLPKEEREKYDKIRLCKDIRNSFFLWSGVLLSVFVKVVVA